jgi:hypothetical protein
MDVVRPILQQEQQTTGEQGSSFFARVLLLLDLPSFVMEVVRPILQQEQQTTSEQGYICFEVGLILASGDACQCAVARPAVVVLIRCMASCPAARAASNTQAVV